jgi:surface antigen
MDKPLITLLILPLTLFGLAGCAQDGTANKPMAGSVIGGIGGALLGSSIGGGSGRVISTAAGAILGGLVGQEVGQSMAETDKLKATQAFDNATRAPIGETIYWNNTPTGHGGSIRPIRDGMSANGQYCREFQTTVYINERTEKMYGSACRKPDGSWEAI